MKRIVDHEKIQKKLEKQERLNRKKILLDEIKNTINHIKFNEQQEALRPYSLAWALNTLNAESTTNLADIKKNYLQLAQQYHPDKNNGENMQPMADLNKAWEIIKTARQ
ncbi:MAG: J domain-containing protein [Bdellovibrionota bacterium]